MANDADIFGQVRAYCEAAGIKPSTLALRALGNGRFFDRLKRRRADDAERIGRVRAYMAQNSTEQKKGAAP